MIKRLGRLQNLEFAEGTSAPDKKAGWDHFPDSLGYACLALRHGLLPYSLGPGPSSAKRRRPSRKQSIAGGQPCAHGRGGVAPFLRTSVRILLALAPETP